MIILGLTGSIGMGKSTAAKIFSELGIPVHDADRTVHELLSVNGAAVHEVLAQFPTVAEQGEKGNEGICINRKKLGEIVFTDPRQRRVLEKILHPMVREKTDAFVAHHKKHGTQIVVLDIPLLFETKGESRVDKILVVYTSEQTQRQRVLSRPRMSEEKFNWIRKAQMPSEEKVKRADFIIEMEHGEAQAKEDILKILAKLGIKL